MEGRRSDGAYRQVRLANTPVFKVGHSLHLGNYFVVFKKCTFIAVYCKSAEQDFFKAKLGFNI